MTVQCTMWRSLWKGLSTVCTRGLTLLWSNAVDSIPLHCCSSGGFMLTVLPSWIIFGVPSQCQILFHVTLHTSPCHLHNIVQYSSKAHVSHKFVHPHFTPGSKDNLSHSTLKVQTYNFSKFFLSSFSEKVLALNFFSSPLYHPPSLPAVYFLSPFLRGLSIAFSPEKCIT